MAEEIDRSHGMVRVEDVVAAAGAGGSVAAGADGLIIEVHPDPEQALSDGYQSLDCSLRRFSISA